MNAEIICVGSEILLGDIVNTNAQYLAKELALLGIDVYYQTVVGDNENRLREALNIAFKRCNMVITTGGLGPTKDDLTKEIVADYFNKKLYFNEEVYKHLEEHYFKKYNLDTISDSHKKQAYMPDGFIIFQNPIGTAPGLLVNENNNIALLLPGPPKEVESVFEVCKKRYLRNLSDKTIVSVNINLKNIGEAIAADMISDLLDLKNPTVAPYAKENGVTLRVTAAAKNNDEALKLINPIVDKIKYILTSYIKDVEY